MLTRARFAVRAVLCVAAPLVVASSVMAGAPDASGRKPPGAGSTINPDMVYLSEGSNASTGAAIRGLTLGSDGLAGTDSQMAKAKADRDHASIVWSPDGKRYAWIEGAFKQTRSIMVSAPGETPQALYSAAFNDGNPYVGDGTDVLAWGPGCTAGTSLVVFSSFNWPSGLMAIDIAADGSVGEPRLLVGIPNAGGVAFSPKGQYLVFRYLSSTESVLLVPVCVAGDPIVLVDKAAIGAADYNENPDNSIISIDWSRHGDRLALSVVTSSDPRYDWRDLKIVNLDYLVSNGSEQVLGYHSVWTVPLDVYFTAASSEHSPQWGPSEPGDVCQRIAFSQSSRQGRKLFLLDINDGRVGDCGINRPLAISAKVPRALDWK